MLLNETGYVCAVGAIALCASALLAGPVRAADDPFEVTVIPSNGRTVTAELADVDGDGRTDVLQAVTFGMPPDESRVLRVYPQRPDGSIAQKPEIEVPIPPASAAYDVADVNGVPGVEFLLLRARGIAMISFVRSSEGKLASEVREARIPEDLTIGVADDERGLDHLDMVSDDFGPEPWLVAPGMQETFFLSPGGELRARISSGSRANYFLQPPGPMLSESDIQIFLDAPRISVADVDGDGRVDIVAAGRHELRVFLRREDGSFPRVADQRLRLGGISVEDHIRGTGSVRTMARDMDGDGFADLIVSKTEGGVMNAASNTYIHFNRGRTWDLAQPDLAFESDEVLSADQLIDVDGDGRVELMRVGVPINVLELIEIFLTQALDAYLVVYPLERPQVGSKLPAKPKPWFEVKLGVPLDFETSRPAGFIPTIEHDLNGDGFRDYLSSSDGTRLEIHLGNREDGFDDKTADQDVATEGQIRPGDIDGDGLTDFVMFNTRRENEPLKLLRNKGRLPGTRATISNAAN